jgi:hypothetical protein
VDQQGLALSEALANQEVHLVAAYSSSADLRDVQVEVRFEPAVVELEGHEAENEVYRIPKPVLAAEQDVDLLGTLVGRIRAYPDGGQAYDLRAFVRIVPVEGEPLLEVASEPIRVSQSTDLAVRASVDVLEVRAGESFVVHVVCENQGSMPARQVRIKLAGLPEGFAATPEALEIDVVGAEGGIEERLITIRGAEGYHGPVVVRVIASAGDEVILAEPVTLDSTAPLPLRLEIESSASAVHAGEAAYIRATAENVGAFPAKGVTARLIDSEGVLGVLVHDVGEIAPGGSAEWVFVVDIPESFPIDAQSTFLVQTVSADGLTSESNRVSLTIACRPVLEVYVEPPTGRIVGGQSVETIVLVKNTGPCAARDVVVGIGGLPSFTQPPDQAIVELPAGGVRYVTFNLLVPQTYRGEAGLYARVRESTGGQAESSPAGFVVRGIPIVWSIVLGFLALLAIAAIVVGTVLYLRAR